VKVHVEIHRHMVEPMADDARLPLASSGPDWARPLVHFEILARDPAAQRAFYGELFNWPIDDGPIMNFPSGLGGPEPGPAGHLRQAERSGVVLYIQVRDLVDSLERVPGLGGTVVSQPFDVPGGPTIASIEDPEGNPLVLVQQ
jgi:predicted enzyme related to lactoylglutathione lyase